MDSRLAWGVLMDCHPIVYLSLSGEVDAKSLGAVLDLRSRRKHRIPRPLEASINPLLETHARALCGVFRIGGLGGVGIRRYGGCRNRLVGVVLVLAALDSIRESIPEEMVGFRSRSNESLTRCN